MDTKRIMIIDDEEDFTFLLKCYFESKNYKVDIAHTLMQGLEQLNQSDPRYILLDNELPDGKGWEKAVDIISRHPGCELFLMSGSYNSEVLSGKFRILEKPFTLTDLDTIVSSQRA